MSPRLPVAALVCLLLSAPAAPAADRDGNYAVWGSGGKSCHTFNTRDEAGDAAYREYIMGYLTAYNALANETYSISGDLGLDGVMDWIRNYCEEKPMHSFDQALVDFTSGHLKERLTQPPGRMGW